MENNYAIIMAGGIGSRFWPFSTHEKPKQFLDILGTGRSLIQLTFDRLSKVCPSNQIYIASPVGIISLPLSLMRRERV